mgnify:CR=1 FL=1|tara:strand:+ start:59 stop:352 length:294 start_codon:yes stop_codon:yes gene_type:complete
MKIVPTTQKSENLDVIAKDAIWGGIRKYLRKKTSPRDAFTDIYYMTFAHTMGVLALAAQETQDPQSSKHVIEIVNSAMTNAIKEWHDLDVTNKPTKH